MSNQLPVITRREIPKLRLKRIRKGLSQIKIRSFPASKANYFRAIQGETLNLKITFKEDLPGQRVMVHANINRIWEDFEFCHDQENEFNLNLVYLIIN